MLDRNRELLIVWSDSSPVSLSSPPTSHEKTPETTPPNGQSTESGLIRETPKGKRARTARDDKSAGAGAPAGTGRDDQSARSGLTRKVPAAAQTGTDNDE